MKTTMKAFCAVCAREFEAAGTIGDVLALASVEARAERERRAKEQPREGVGIGVCSFACFVQRVFGERTLH